ncbi:MAG: sugar phosphate isomerase/epimerase [Clostridia bacterium]|nr:sugar phosphate isomerase/epimerase [Clostridia bacterium]
MRLSTSTNLMNFDARLPYMVSMPHAISALAAAGYRYLDANLCGCSRRGKRFAPMTEDNWEQHVKDWRRLADDIGVQFRQGHAYWSVNGPVEKGGVPGGEDGEELMRRSVLAAQILGIEWLVVHPSTYLQNGTPLTKEAIFEANLAYFSRWAAFYADHGIGMAIENMPSLGRIPSFFSDIDTLNALVDALDRPNVGACLDTGHAHVSGLSPADCVLKLGNRLKATHINDNSAVGRDEHVAPFMGTINWPQTVKALRDIGYENDFAFETQNLTAVFPLRIQGDLLRFSYTLGEYLLSDDLFYDVEARKRFT